MDAEKTSFEQGDIIGLRDVSSSHNRCLDSLNNIGYEVIFKVVNPKQYGWPQSRPRIFYQGIDRQALGSATARVQMSKLLVVWDALDGAHGTGNGFRVRLEDLLFSEQQVRDSKAYTELAGAGQSAKRFKAATAPLKWEQMHEKLREKHDARA